MTMRNVVFELQEIKNRILTEAHYELHRGNSYNFAIYDNVMSDGDYLSAGFKTGTGECHMIVDFASKDAARLTLYEDATWSGGQTGTQAIVYNRNRRSSNMSNLYDDWRASGVWESSGMVKVGMSGISGTEIYHIHVYGAMDWMTGLEEFVLDTGTQYAVILEAKTDSNAGYMSVNWYEK